MDYLRFLADVHRQLAPGAYLEIGVRWGHSLSLARCRAVGIDPAFGITAELDGDVALFRTTSDEYFSRPDPLAATGGTRFGLAFIDGLHLFEYAYRDFVYAERHSSPHGVIIFDDALPRSVDEAARERHTNAWTGDVFLMLEVLARYRPDLVVVPVDTVPTGLLVVAGLDPSNTVLVDKYDQAMDELRRADPQDVPTGLMKRSTAAPPNAVLESGIFTFLRAHAQHSSDEISSRLRQMVTTELGSGFLAQPT